MSDDKPRVTTFMGMRIVHLPADHLVRKMEKQIACCDMLLKEVRGTYVSSSDIAALDDRLNESVALIRQLRVDGTESSVSKLHKIEDFLWETRRKSVRDRLDQIKWLEENGIKVSKTKGKDPLRIPTSTNPTSSDRRDLCPHGKLRDRCARCDPDGYIFHFGDWEDD